jgi:hypothetical protein
MIKETQLNGKRFQFELSEQRMNEISKITGIDSDSSLR